MLVKVSLGVCVDKVKICSCVDVLSNRTYQPEDQSVTPEPQTAPFCGHTSTRSPRLTASLLAKFKLFSKSFISPLMRVPLMVLLYDGVAIASKIAMMLIVTSNSINVTPVASRRIIIPKNIVQQP